MAAVVHFAILSLAQLRFRYICGANAGLNQFPPPQFDEVLLTCPQERYHILC